MYSVQDWENFSILTDGRFVTYKNARDISVSAQNIEITAQIKNKPTSRDMLG